MEAYLDAIEPLPSREPEQAVDPDEQPETGDAAAVRDGGPKPSDTD